MLGGGWTLCCHPRRRFDTLPPLAAWRAVACAPPVQQQRYSQRAAAAALSCLALLMALEARWFLFVVLLVIIGFDLVWFVQATDRLQFVNVRWR